MLDIQALFHMNVVMNTNVSVRTIVLSRVLITFWRFCFSS